jgi:hypothetical protein
MFQELVKEFESNPKRNLQLLQDKHDLQKNLMPQSENMFLSVISSPNASYGHKMA